MRLARKKHKKQKKQPIGAFVVIIAASLLIVAGSIVSIKFIYSGRETSQSVSSGEDTAVALALSQSEMTLYVGTSAGLSVSPEGTAVSWRSENDAVASVDENGAVFAVSPGSVNIWAENGGSSVCCAVTVLAMPEVTVENTGGLSIDEAGLQTLRDLTAQYPLQVSVYYRDLASGTVIEYNSSKKYSAGSVVKAPYCKWLLASGADLSEELTFSRADIVEGAGSVQNSPEGTVFTVQELIAKAIQESDNTAYHMLTLRFGFDGYLAYAKSLGVAANQNGQNLFGSMSAVGAGIFFSDIYVWSQSDTERGGILIEDMCSTSYKQLISSVTDVPVAHKYGYNNGTSGFHDAAIVYAEHPYVLTIFTNLDPDAEGTVPYIQSLAACINGISEKSRS